MRGTNLWGKCKLSFRSKSTIIKPDAAIVLYHLHARCDGRPFGGVEGGVNRVVEDTIRPVIAGMVVDNKIIP